MSFWQSFLEAAESISANKLRSSLTILGIVIGVGAVIAMLAIGEGAQAAITGQIQGIGTNLLFVFRGGSEDVRNPQPLTLGDADAIGDPFQAPSVLGVAPVLSGSAEISFAGETTRSDLMGVTPEYAAVRNAEITEGEFISTTHVLGQASVAVIGTEVADNLFGRKEALVGETIRIEGQPYRVIGVLKEKGGSAFGSEDNQVLVPLSTARVRLLRRSASDRIDIIFVQAASGELVNQATEEISQILRTRHRTAIGADDFTVFSQQSALDIFTSITNLLTIFLGGIAAISLLVGGIGIMNIMLVSVIERTREIGLRKAMGARKRDIVLQFLTESALLSLTGGVIGIGLGWLIGAIVGFIAANADAELTPIIGLNAILLATGVSTAVGLLAGLYPSIRAANLEPVEALRYE
jgi:putative ABC transport system permease protein